jgi:hypothetical protein
MTTITTLADLAAETCACEATEPSIAHRLFKDTECGISFTVATVTPSLLVGVAGYCEGDLDNDLPWHWLTAPFTSEEWDAAVEAAEKDGEDRWNETHGCPHCDTGKACPDGDACAHESQPDDWNAWPINPECAACGGEGMIL